jgi:outer membrane receptor protein involved in Fe transport
VAGLFIVALMLAALGNGVLYGQSPGALSPDREQAGSVLFEDIPKVETASLYAQTLQEAPANVTVITRQEIRRYGYRTLAEALSNVRGFYVTSDGALLYAGVRGFNLPGDYNTRILVLVNGHAMTDNVYGAMYMFGQDFGIDMDLIERIEVVRGPSSAIYGSNGIFATINIFTRAPVDSPRATATAELGSFGDRKVQVSASRYLGRGANLLLSFSGFDVQGRTLDDPQLGSTGEVGAEHGYHIFSQLTRGNWSLTANVSDRKLLAPFGWYGSDYGDTGTSSRDGRSFVESSWTHAVGKGSSLRWRLYYDQYRYYGRYDSTTPGEPTTDERDYADGDWVGTQLTYQTGVPRLGKLTVGGEFNADIRNLQQTYDVGSPGLVRDTSEPNRSFGLFAQQEWDVSRKWTLVFGVRGDDSKRDGAFVSPKLSAVYRPDARSAYKFLYGRAFRNPSAFERYWLPNPQLAAEKMHTFEFVREKGLGRSLDAVATVYYYRLSDLIEGVPATETELQYRNWRDGRAVGAEFELRGRPLAWLEAAASGGWQEARYAQGGDLPNSPDKIVQVRAAMPLVHERLTMSLAGRYLSRRMTLYGWEVAGAPVADLTFTTKHFSRDFDLQCGIRNLLDRRYFDPMSEEHTLAVMPRAGRSIFLRLLWHYGE